MDSNIDQQPINKELTTNGHRRTDHPMPVDVPTRASVWHLPGAYLRVIFQPSVALFAHEARRARWGLIWFQLLLLILITGFLGVESALHKPAAISSAVNIKILASLLSIFSVTTSIGFTVIQLIYIPLSFFFVMVLQYLLSRIFGGQGTFVAQSYTNLLYSVPLTTIGKILAAIFIFFPFAGPFTTFLLRSGLNLLLLFYAVVLNVLSLMGVHNFGGGKALAVIIIQVVLTVALIIALIIFAIVLLAKLLKSLS